MKYIYYTAMSLLFLLTNCKIFKKSDVTITKEFVINPYWDSYDNSISICKMNLRDSTIIININNVTAQQLYKYLECDSSYSFMSNVIFNGEDYSARKVYYNQFNGFFWIKQLSNGQLIKLQNLDPIHQETWYSIAGLGEEATIYYLYIDKLDSLRTFKLVSSDWTNI